MAVYNFRNQNEFFKFVTDNKILRKLGEGADGVCYKKGDEVVKILSEDYDGPVFTLSSDDIDTKTFIFPDDFYYIDGRITGLKTKYIKNDILLNSLSNFVDIRKYLKPMLIGLDELITDIKKLSDECIYLYDLAGNLMFDGTDYYVIDTIQYRYLENYSPEEVFEKNIEVLKYAFDIEIGLGHGYEKYVPIFNSRIDNIIENSYESNKQAIR